MMTEEIQVIKEKDELEANDSLEGIVEDEVELEEDEAALESEDELEDAEPELTETELAILDTENPADAVETVLGVSMRDLKLAIRSNQFSDAEVAAMVTEGVIEQDVVDLLLQHPVVLKVPEKPKAAEKPKKVKAAEKPAKKPVPKASLTGQVSKKIQDILIASPIGLTIEEICVQLGVLTEDADPTDAETKAMKKRYRTFARKAVDSHQDGSRNENLGRNRLYSIGEVEDRVMEDTVEEDETEEDET